VGQWILGGSDTILKIVVGPNTTSQNRLVRCGFPPLINTLSGHHLSDVGLLTPAYGAEDIKARLGDLFQKNS